jgi:glutathione S-transferase
LNGGADRDGAARLHIKARAPIDVHYWPTPNGWKVTIMLEECGLRHVRVQAASKVDMADPKVRAVRFEQRAR